MTYKEFKKWCELRVCDGCWGMTTAIFCIDLLKSIQKMPFWKRKSYWKNEWEDMVVNEIVNPINKKIAEQMKEGAEYNMNLYLGQTVYKIYNIEVDDINFKYSFVQETGYLPCDKDLIGKSIFLTKEEANIKLKQMKEIVNQIK
ncbi:MAG: hypothetical protein KBT03_09215 [Bacteroidales bacterium]|nr:hypothetical protein [Candidatus Scybalousia scybalohippi]